MLEYFIASYIDAKLNPEKIERFASGGSPSILGLVISTILSVSAAYLSFTCKNQTGQASQYIFAILAFLLGPIYLIYYFFVNFLSGQCR